MNISRSHATLVLALAGALALSACGKKEEAAPPPGAATPAPAPAQPAPVDTAPAAPAAVPVSVTSVELGNAVDADSKKITNPATTFASGDTIYASVTTAGSAPTTTLAAKWTFGEQNMLVNESHETIAPDGNTITTFHIAKADGWPEGAYKVEISLDGKPVATKDFSVH